jgi:hypothetical protein
MASTEGWAILVDEPLPGPSEIIEKSAGATSDHLIATLMAEAEKNKVAKPGDRGSAMWQSIIDAILGRRVDSVRGPYEVPVPWLSFHIPPEGVGQLSIATNDTADWGVQLKAVGTGWGSGRSVTIDVSRDYQERRRCFQVDVALSVQCTLYKDGYPPRTDVLSVAGQSLREFGKCPYCCPADERVSRMERSAGEWLDLTADTVGQVVEKTIEITDKRSIEASVPFKPPGLDTEIGVTWTRENRLTCRASYTFPPGRRYRPYMQFGRAADLPYWRWE